MPDSFDTLSRDTTLAATPDFSAVRARARRLRRRRTQGVAVAAAAVVAAATTVGGVVLRDDGGATSSIQPAAPGGLDMTDDAAALALVRDADATAIQPAVHPSGAVLSLYDNFCRDDVADPPEPRPCEAAVATRLADGRTASRMVRSGINVVNAVAVQDGWLVATDSDVDAEGGATWRWGLLRLDGTLTELQRDDTPTETRAGDVAVDLWLKRPSGGAFFYRPADATVHRTAEWRDGDLGNPYITPDGALVAETSRDGIATGFTVRRDGRWEDHPLEIDGPAAGRQQIGGAGDVVVLSEQTVRDRVPESIDTMTGVWLSRDQGRTWQRYAASPDPTSEAPFHPHVGADGTIWLAPSGGPLLSTWTPEGGLVDAGDTIPPLRTGPLDTDSTGQITLADDGRVFANLFGQRPQRVFVSDDDARTWRPVALPGRDR